MFGFGDFFFLSVYLFVCLWVGWMVSWLVGWLVGFFVREVEGGLFIFSTCLLSRFSKKNQWVHATKW